MIEPSEIIRSKRQALALTINKRGELIVKAPLFIAENEIYKFIRAKEDWILNKINKVKSSQGDYADLIYYQNFLLFGKRYKAVFSDVKSAKFVNEVCYIPNIEDKNVALHKVTLTYKKLAKKWLAERTAEIASALGVKYKDFKISNTKGRWGACNDKKVIDLNYRVVCLSPPLIDYVIVHELSHLSEMNHSPKFWSLVERVMPDYKKRRKAVKDMGLLFEIYK